MYSSSSWASSCAFHPTLNFEFECQGSCEAGSYYLLCYFYWNKPWRSNSNTKDQQWFVNYCLYCPLAWKGTPSIQLLFSPQTKHRGRGGNYWSKTFPGGTFQHRGHLDRKMFTFSLLSWLTQWLSAEGLQRVWGNDLKTHLRQNLWALETAWEVCYFKNKNKTKIFWFLSRWPALLKRITSWVPELF